MVANTTLPNRAGIVYELSGTVEVGSDVGGDGAMAGGVGVTLTIEPGVVVYGRTLQDQLVINRGSRINAVGTVSQPIIFTSRTNMLGGSYEHQKGGEWSGITILGRAPVSGCPEAVPGGSANCEQTVPGVGAKYGGGLANDNSGSLRYVQLRFAANEITSSPAALHLAGVGSATTIDHLQIATSGVIGVHLMGGRVNLAHLIVASPYQGALATSFGYRGTIQFFLGITDLPGDFARMIVTGWNENESADSLPREYVRISNASVLGSDAGQVNLTLEGRPDLVLLNSILSGEFCVRANGASLDAANPALEDLGPPIFRSVVAHCGWRPFWDNEAALTAIFALDPNNDLQHILSLSGGYLNGPNENAVPAIDPTGFNDDPYAVADPAAPNRLIAVPYIGAVQNAADTWFQGWTCNYSFADFGGRSKCETPPR